MHSILSQTRGRSAITGYSNIVYQISTKNVSHKWVRYVEVRMCYNVHTSALAVYTQYLCPKKYTHGKRVVQVPCKITYVLNDCFVVNAAWQELARFQWSNTMKDMGTIGQYPNETHTTECNTCVNFLRCTVYIYALVCDNTGLILGLRPANERRRKPRIIPWNTSTLST